MRKFLRLAVAGALIAGMGGMFAASGASASVPAVSKTCQSLNTLNENLDAAIASGDAGKVDSGAINSLSKSFRKAAKTAPKPLKSAMNTIADVAAHVAGAGSPAAAAAALKKAGAKFTSALVTWGTYLTKNCSGSSSSGSSAASATVPRDCSALETGAVSELLGGEPVLDSDSNFDTTLRELHCIWYTNDAVSEKVSVQLGLAADFIGFYGSQEGTGTSKYTKVGGFDEGRLYGDDILIAQRNGLAVAVDAGSVYPQSTQEQIVRVALAATTT